MLCCTASSPFLLLCALDFLTKPALPQASHCICTVHIFLSEVRCLLCYVNQFVLILDEEFSQENTCSVVSSSARHKEHRIISIFVSIVSFWLLMFSLTLMIFWIRAPFPFSMYSFLCHFSFPTIFIFVLLHCPCSLFLISL